MIGALPFNHRLAIVIFLTFTVGYFGGSLLLDWMGPTPTLLRFIWFLFWPFAVITAVAIAVSAAFWRPQGTGWAGIGERLAPLVSLTAAIAIAYGLSVELARAERKSFARAHSTELGGTPPQAVIYSEGIPEGGIAIVRLPGQNPETLPQTTMVRLTGERIKDCHPLDEDDWFCTFD